MVNLATTYHYRAHRWSSGSKYQTNPCYVLCKENLKVLSVNWVDGPAAYFDYRGQGVATFNEVLRFIKRCEGNVLIVCDQGMSRSPSMALLYLSKVTQELPHEDFSAARREFKKLYPRYQPGSGITEFITKHWTSITAD